MTEEQKDAKERLEQAERALHQARERLNQVVKERQNTLIRLDAHYKELLKLDVSKVHAWASVKMQLVSVVDALDAMLPVLRDRDTRTEQAWKQAMLWARQAGVA
jgi:molecular chaperone GrpE (heat shock protein)